MSAEVKLKVVQGQAIHYKVYTGFAKFKDLAAISFVDRAQMDTGEGVQRELDSRHAREFAQYVRNPAVLDADKATAPPLIFSLRKKGRFEAGPAGTGSLFIPRDPQAMARLDAQHRMQFTQDIEEEVQFVIYYDLTPEEELAIFTIFNDKHKGLIKSLVDRNRAYLLGDERSEEQVPHVAIAMRLNSDPKSPWLKQIDTGGEKTPGTKRRVSLRTMQQAVRSLISG